MGLVTAFAGFAAMFYLSSAGFAVFILVLAVLKVKPPVVAPEQIPAKRRGGTRWRTRGSGHRSSPRRPASSSAGRSRSSKAALRPSNSAASPRRPLTKPTPRRLSRPGSSISSSELTSSTRSSRGNCPLPTRRLPTWRCTVGRRGTTTRGQGSRARCPVLAWSCATRPEASLPHSLHRRRQDGPHDPVLGERPSACVHILR